ncbi:hypothetical protein LOTGIDRAFT_155881 [Lottia gigantea]|uniref:Farnesoic acid O-methyl transferase domain-containing protein n=1 Tax=Lottia gigantea TaxID=225164 RepID=V3ZKE9_LOTGI|nr:hypothetical protein LOTGIDRAFT_155881 [Lottia gigantea]ESO82845.1 hypothetical protein LOTGIDRAFT_155881 [Lottia gigantea]
MTTPKFTEYLSQGGSQLQVFSPDNQFHAEPLLRYGFEISNITNLQLGIKACADAHVIIQKGTLPMLNTDGNYAYIIGSYGNNRVELAKSMHSVPRLASISMIPLDCNEVRPFWISWKDGDLKIGKGTVLLADEIIAYSVGPLVDYKYAFIITGWGSHGCWTIAVANQIVKTKWRKSSVLNSKIHGSDVISFTTKSKMECLSKCVHATNLSCACRQLSFNGHTKECLIINYENPVTIVDDENWNTWYLV